MGGWPSVLRGVLAVVAIAALITATWLVVVGRRQSHRAAALRQANTVAIARNRALGAQLNTLTATNRRTQARIARIDGDHRTAVDRLDPLVSAWNGWLTTNNALIETANGIVDASSAPPASAVRAALDPRRSAVDEREAAFRDAVAKFAVAAAKARQDASSTKP